MEPLRWILIAAGIAFILVIYILGRNRRSRDLTSIDEFETDAGSDIKADIGDETVAGIHAGMDAETDLPAFCAQNLDDVDEGVGEVRVVSGGGSLSAEMDNAFSQENSSASNEKESDNKSKETPNDIVVIYILPKADKLLNGAQINSAAQALGLSFGDMNIFHYMSNGRNVFSLANMLEPGSFDADTIHDLKTSGLTIFMQIKGDDPMDDLTEMLQRSYQLAGLLEARLCNHKRQPLTEQDAENYRAQVRAVDV